MIYLECTECKMIYTDMESLELAIKMYSDYERLCKADGIKPIGICPCPVITCKGGTELKTNKAQSYQKAIEYIAFP